MSRSNEIWNRQLNRGHVRLGQHAPVPPGASMRILLADPASLGNHRLGRTPRPPQGAITQSRRRGVRRTYASTAMRHHSSAATHHHQACCASCADSRGPNHVRTWAIDAPWYYIHCCPTRAGSSHHQPYSRLSTASTTHHHTSPHTPGLLHLLVDLGAQQHAVRLELVLQRLQRHLHDLLGRVLARTLHREVEVVVAHAHRDGAGHL